MFPVVLTFLLSRCWNDAVACSLKISTLYAKRFVPSKNSVRSKSKPLSYFMITCIVYGLCHRMIRTFRHAGGSSKRRFPVRLFRANVFRLADNSNRSEGYGNGVFGNTPSVTKRILTIIPITSTTIRSNTVWLNVSPIGLIRVSTILSAWGNIHWNGRLQLLRWGEIWSNGFPEGGLRRAEISG